MADAIQVIRGRKGEEILFMPGLYGKSVLYYYGLYLGRSFSILIEGYWVAHSSSGLFFKYGKARRQFVATEKKELFLEARSRQLITC